MRLPFFYGWLVVAVVFVTMGIGVNARTAFSLLFPPLIDEFGWDRGVTAGAFSFGFLVSAVMSPIARAADGPGRSARRHRAGRRSDGGRAAAGAVHDATLASLCDAGRAGGRRQRVPGLLGPVAVPAQLVRAPARPRHRHRLCRRRRRLDRAAAVAADRHRRAPAGARRAGRMGVLVLVVLAPINLLLRKSPQDMGLQPDGDRGAERDGGRARLQRGGRRPGPPSTGRSAAPCARRASGGSRSATSAASTPGTRCRCTRPST